MSNRVSLPANHSTTTEGSKSADAESVPYQTDTDASLIHHLTHSAAPPDTPRILRLQRLLGNSATRQLVGMRTLPLAGIVNRKLDATTRRLRRDAASNNAVIEDSWTKLLTENGYIALDVKKVSIPTLIPYFEDNYKKLVSADADMDNIGRGLSANQQRNARDRIKDEIENYYGKILTAAEIRLNEANQLYDDCISAGIKVIQDYVKSKDRKFPGTNNPIPPDSGLKKHEKEKVLPPEIGKKRDPAIFWGTEEGFVRRVFELYHEDTRPKPAALSTTDAATLAVEKGYVNTQLAAWATVRAGAPGVNDGGTWGTSYTGAGTSYTNPPPLNAVVWNALRTWWIAKQYAFFTPSLTTSYSLKMDRVPPDTTLSNRFNYHVNVVV